VVEYEELRRQLGLLDAVRPEREGGCPPLTVRSMKPPTGHELRPLFESLQRFLVDVPQGRLLAPEHAARLSSVLGRFGHPNDALPDQCKALVRAILAGLEGSDASRWTALLGTGKARTRIGVDSEQHTAVHDLAGKILGACDLPAEALDVVRLSPSPVGQTLLPKDGRFTDWRQSSSTIAIRRLGLESEFSAAIEKGVYPVVLWGESGNGKSYLASEFLASHAEAPQKPAAFVRIGANRDDRESVYSMDLERALDLAGIQHAGLGKTDKERVLRQAVSGQECPFSGLVLDDATPGDMTRLIPEDAIIPIVVTARDAVPGVTNVLVPSFEPEEAIEFTRSRLPDDSSSAIADLCSILGHRPLPLEMAIGVVAEGYFELPDLVAALRESAVHAVTASETLVGDSSRQPLVRLYSETIGRIEVDEMAMEIVDALLWTCHGPVTEEVLEARMWGQTPSKAQRLVHLASSQKLVRIGLVVNVDGVWEMNELTREILRTICAHRINSFVERFHHGLLIESNDSAKSSYVALLKDEYKLSKSILSEFSAQGECGLLCVSDNIWLLTLEGHPWVEDAAIGEGKFLVFVKQSGVAYWDGIHQWRDMNVAQSQLFASMCHLYMDATFKRIYEAYPIAEGINPDLPGLSMDAVVSEADGFRHLTIEQVARGFAESVNTATWAACGKWRVALAESEDLPQCAKCADALGSESFWSDVYQDVRFHRKVAYYARQQKAALLARIFAIQMDAAKRLGHISDSEELRDRSLHACTEDAAPTLVAVGLCLALIDDELSWGRSLAPWLVDWMTLHIVQEDVTAYMQLRWSRSLLERAQDPVAAREMITTALNRSDVQSRTRMWGEYLLADVMLKESGLEASLPLFDQALRNLATLEADDPLRTTIQRLWEIASKSQKVDHKE
jgi:hypothetical protein